MFTVTFELDAMYVPRTRTEGFSAVISETIAIRLESDPLQDNCAAAIAAANLALRAVGRAPLPYDCAFAIEDEKGPIAAGSTHYDE